MSDMEKEALWGTWVFLAIVLLWLTMSAIAWWDKRRQHDRFGDESPFLSDGRERHVTRRR